MPRFNQAALASAARFVMFSAAAAMIAAVSSVLPSLHVSEPYNYILGVALAAALKYVEAHRRTA